MDLIYMNAEREDIGVLQNYELDLAFGSDENSFECVVDRNNHCCGFGFFLYIEGTEYGGIIDSVEIKNSAQEIVYCGRTWHGVLNSKVLEPDSGADYLVCSGEANAVIGELVSRMGLSDLFIVSDEDSGLEIKSYKMNRYISGYDGIMKMLKTVDGKLQLRVQSNGQVLLSAVPIVDYTTDGLESDLIDLDVKRTANTVNHLICLGQGNLADRLVVHLYVDEDGNISQTQTFTGVDEYVAVYDYSGAEDEADLVNSGTEHLKELMQQDDLSVDVNDVDDPYDVGDLVGATDNITNISITVPVKKKIVTIKNGIVTIDIKTETSNVSTHASEASSGGGGSGEAGADGQDGKDGQDGVSCTHEWNGTVLTITSASGTSSADLKGEPGKDGYTPQKGVDYFDGQDGKDGVDGSPGQDGSPGKDGQDGVSVTHSWSGTTLTVTSASGTSSADLKGEAGSPGAAGANATINGMNVLTIEAGDNIELEQNGNVLTINASGGSGTAEVLTVEKIREICYVPSDFEKNYTQLSYIESSGKQYVNTGFKPNQDTSLTMEISDWTASETSTAPFGSRTGSSASDYYLVMITSGGALRSDYGNSQVSMDKSVLTGAKITITREKNVTTVGSSTVTNTESTFSGSYPMFLFGQNSGGNLSHGVSAKIYSCKIYDNGTLVRDFVPCINASGAYGLYDKVNEQFYANAGSGSFTGA